MNKFEKIKKIVKSYFDDSKGSHGWDHTIRVYNMCLHIGKIEDADIEILRYASILHDIARNKEDKNKGKVCHAEHGSMIAKEILKNEDFEETFIENVAHCIESHRYRNNKIPGTKEAKILFDSDKLDSIGAVGIARAYLFAGEVGAMLHDKDVDINNTEIYTKDDTGYREYLVKLRYIKDKILTDEGRKIAEERHKFMDEFFSRINKEVDGIR